MRKKKSSDEKKGALTSDFIYKQLGLDTIEESELKNVYRRKIYIIGPNYHHFKPSGTPLLRLINSYKRKPIADKDGARVIKMDQQDLLTDHFLKEFMEGITSALTENCKTYEYFDNITRNNTQYLIF